MHSCMYSCKRFGNLKSDNFLYLRETLPWTLATRGHYAKNFILRSHGKGEGFKKDFDVRIVSTLVVPIGEGSCFRDQQL